MKLRNADEIFNEDSPKLATNQNLGFRLRSVEELYNPPKV